MKFQFFIVAILLAATAQASPRSDLAAQMAYAVVTTSRPEVPDNRPPATCPECGGKGWVGDGTVKMKCPAGCPASKDFSEPISAKPKPVPRQTSTRWSIGSQPYKTASAQQIADHLSRDHGIDPTGYSREDLLNIHDNAHSGSSCPTGTCPRK